MSEAGADKKRMIHTLLKFEAFILAVAGFFLSTKQFFSEIVFIDTNTDLYIGYGLIIVGFINIIIANKFFGSEAK